MCFVHRADIFRRRITIIGTYSFSLSSTSTGDSSRFFPTDDLMNVRPEDFLSLTYWSWPVSLKVWSLMNSNTALSRIDKVPFFWCNFAIVFMFSHRFFNSSTPNIEYSLSASLCKIRANDSFNFPSSLLYKIFNSRLIASSNVTSSKSFSVTTADLASLGLWKWNVE